MLWLVTWDRESAGEGVAGTRRRKGVGLVALVRTMVFLLVVEEGAWDLTLIW